MMANLKKGNMRTVTLHNATILTTFRLKVVKFNRTGLKKGCCIND